MGDVVSRAPASARMPGLELVRQPTSIANTAMEKDPTGIMPNCKEVHRLTSEGLDRHLSLVERARMRLHLLICGPCTVFTEQMTLLRKAMRQLTHGAQGESDLDPK